VALLETELSPTTPIFNPSLFSVAVKSPGISPSWKEMSLGWVRRHVENHTVKSKSSSQVLLLAGDVPAAPRETS
jgi:hypothetical protein